MLHRRKICLQKWVCPHLGLHKLALSGNQAGYRSAGSGGTIQLWPLGSKVVSLPAHRLCLFEVPLNKGTSCYSEKQAAVFHLTKHHPCQIRSVARLLQPAREQHDPRTAPASG